MTIKAVRTGSLVALLTAAAYLGTGDPAYAHRRISSAAVPSKLDAGKITKRSMSKVGSGASFKGKAVIVHYTGWL